jgi:S-layer homology domain
MTNPNRPNNSDERRSILSFDELVAVLIAFGSIGGILWWGLSRTDGGLNFAGGTPATTDVATNPVGPMFGSTTSATGTTTKVTTAPATAPAKPQVATAPADNPGGSWLSTAAPIAGGAIIAGGTAGAPLSSNAVAPDKPVVEAPKLTVPEPTVSVAFTDVPTDYWAGPFINALAQRGITKGVEANQFQPDRPVTRGEYAALIQSVFEDKSQSSIQFKDVPPGYWANEAIDTAVKANFLKGYPENTFEPDKPISKMEVLLSLTQGFNLKNNAGSPDLLKLYQDNAQVPGWAVPAIASATKANVVVNHPSLDMLNPNQPATRAEVVAMLHQALVAAGKVPAFDSAYVVKPQ